MRTVYALAAVLLFFHPARACPCPPNEICLRNRTCHCPFFRYGALCLRRRYQTIVNTTLDSLQTARHLLSAPMLLTIDSTNVEAMQELSAVLVGVANVGNVVTSVVDSLDTLIGGEPSATMEIANLTIDGYRANVTVEYRLPPLDFFFFYMHFGSSAPPCPPFDAINSCCRGDMGSEFHTVQVDCTGDPVAQMGAFVGSWDGWDAGGNRFMVSVDLAVTPPDADGRYRFGIGMAVFGRLAQNTESRVEISINTSTTIASTGSFQYSIVEDARLQLEAYGTLLFARLVVKALGVSDVQSLRYAPSEESEFLLPNCTTLTRRTPCGPAVVIGCNVTLDAEFVEMLVPLPALTPTTLVYALLLKGSTLTRVLVKTDDTVLQHCNPVVHASAYTDASFTVEILQRGETLYAGPVRLVNFTDVSMLTMRLHSLFNETSFRFDNISVVYSLVDAARIVELMPDGVVTPELEALCEDGDRCVIETLLSNGVCQTDTKCEWQGDDLVVLPVYPWKQASYESGAYTVMLTEIREYPLVSMTRRLMGWLARFFR